VTATITLASPLLPSQPETPVTPVSFSLNDGVQTLTNTSPGTLAFFNFGTDSMGNIDAWDFAVENNSLPITLLIMSLNDEDGINDTGMISISQQGANFGNPGTWKSVPAPPLSNLAGLGVLALAFLWRRRQIFGFLQ
jgi:MYXO-CTERM domain-containing protein